ncbi:hypothetical protein Syun_001826 [Stephania yunnanensis]|uniref:Xyloglucan endo-transglycosylase C-terminal domain-containing protein n=1 Tax=Stephania yunnanensis TaxID=152371 RepID=A0AAP0LEM4_9MAGN
MPIREFKNLESLGIAFPNNQSMMIYYSLSTAEDPGKTNSRQAPFKASFRNFSANACVVSPKFNSCNVTSSPSSANNNYDKSWLSLELDSTSQQRMKFVQTNYMTYNFCTYTKQFPQGLPQECNSVQIESKMHEIR